MTGQTEIPQLVEHLFRHEAGKIIPVLARLFGPSNLHLAEDIVQDSLIEAMEHWQYEGIPQNPAAWLSRVARNKALNILHREKYKRGYQAAAAHEQKPEFPEDSGLEHLFSEEEIRDDQLRMIFACCHPSISPVSQIALALKTLCGFSIPEIAKAFLTSEETISKRLTRARQRIREAKDPFEIPHGKELDRRLSAVLETLYLLFNEGYSASQGNEIIRQELCEEAIRLAGMIVAGKAIKHKESVHALIALMLINASRFKARQDKDGNLLTLAEQDRTLWDRRLLNIELEHLAEAANNDRIGPYHIQAAISAQYSIAADYESTDWVNILALYDSLLELDRSPMVILNRAIVVLNVHGPVQALDELEQIKADPALKTYPLFYSTQAEFHIRKGDFPTAVTLLLKAIELAPLESERKLLKRKLAVLRDKNKSL